MIVHDKFHKEESPSYKSIKRLINDLNYLEKVEFSIYCIKSSSSFITRDTLANQHITDMLQNGIDFLMKFLEDHSTIFRRKVSNLQNECWTIHRQDYVSSWGAAWWAISSLAHLAHSINNYFYLKHNKDANRLVIASVVCAMFGSRDLFNQHLIVLNSYFSTTTSTQPFNDLYCKIVYLIDELEENLIVQNNNKFFLNMNGIDRCQHLGDNSQDELIQKILHSDESFWWFARRWLNRLYP